MDGHTSPRNLLALATIFMLAFALRWPQMADSLWLDELHTAWTVDGSWSEVFERARIGNQAPLYFWLVKVGRDLFGGSELTFRALSLFAGLGLTILAGVLTQHWTKSHAAGWLAAVLIAIDRNWIFYSQEARPYAVLQLVAWCHAGIAWELPRRNTYWLRAGFVGGAVAQFYLHYTAALFIVAEVVFLLVAIMRGGAVYSWRQLFRDLSIVAVTFVPAAWSLAEIADRRAQWQLLFSLLSSDFIAAFGLQSFALVLVVSIVGLLANRVASVSRSRETLDGRRLALFAMFLPLASAWSATMTGVASLFSVRYLVAPLVGAAIWSAITWHELSQRWARVVVAILAVAATILTSGMIEQFRHDCRLIGDRVQNWRGAVSFVNQHADPARDVVFVRSAFLEEDALVTANALQLEYLLAPVNSLYRLRLKAQPLATTENKRNLGEPAAPHVIGTIWVLFNGRPSSRQRFLQNVFDHSSPRLFITEFGEVTVIRQQRRGESAK